MIVIEHYQEQANTFSGGDHNGSPLWAVPSQAGRFGRPRTSAMPMRSQVAMLHRIGYVRFVRLSRSIVRCEVALLCALLCHGL